MKISVVIPVLNEAGCIEECLGRLQDLRRGGHEVIVVDGGSVDETVAIAAPLCDTLLNSEKGRAWQMNAGAEAASGKILVFIHADTLVTFELDKVLGRFEGQYVWGCFRVHLSGTHPLFRLFDYFIHQRARLTGTVTGDQVMFIRRELFHHAGGFPNIPLMEDVALSKKLKSFRPPVCLRHKVITSSRRWEEYGIVKTMLGMWWRRLRYAIGVNPAVLAKDYD